MSTTPPFGFGKDDEPNDDTSNDDTTNNENPNDAGRDSSDANKHRDQPDAEPSGASAMFGLGLPGFGMSVPGLPGAEGMPDLGSLFTQLGRMFSWSGGPVNWDVSTDIARNAPEVSQDATISPSQQKTVEQALDVAGLWLDEVSALPTSGTKAQAWNRAQWVHHSLPQWKPYVEPVAEKVNASLRAVLTQQLPQGLTESTDESDQLSNLMGPMGQMLTTMGAAMFGSQLGQALAALAQEVLGTTDNGLPLAPTGVAALLPTNVKAFAEQVQRPEQEVLYYLALREEAALRLFTHCGWLAGRLRTDITRYASDITIDTERLEEDASQLDPSVLDPSMLSDPQALENLSGMGIISEDLFTPVHTAQQEQVLQRLEGLLALIEGWIDTVVTQAATAHLPGVAALGESMRRRRATGGPAEQTFANLVGLHLRPRRSREAAALWQAVQEARGVQGRDAVWDHPDFLPDVSDLDDPQAFASRTSSSTDTDVDWSALGLGKPSESNNDSDRANGQHGDDTPQPDNS